MSTHCQEKEISGQYYDLARDYLHLGLFRCSILLVDVVATKADYCTTHSATFHNHVYMLEDQNLCRKRAMFIKRPNW